MRRERVHKIDGVVMSAWIDALPTEMEDIGVGIGTIVENGVHGFELEGAELREFVRSSLMAILGAGGLPLRFIPVTPTSRFDSMDGRWEVETKYGSTPETIVEGIIADWRASGVLVPGWGHFWFGTREVVDEQNRRWS